MDKLELKHLAPYLPYGLKVLCLHPQKLKGREPVSKRNVFELVGMAADRPHVNLQGLKNKDSIFGMELRFIVPILRPLTDLTEDGLLSSINRQKFNTHFNSTGIYLTRYNETAVSLSEFRKIEYYLYENHFDVFGLIDKGFAIDINTLKEFGNG